MLWFKRNAEQVPIIKDLYVLGTLIQLKVFGENAKVAISESIKRLLEIDDKMSVFKEDSEVALINRNAGGEYQEISEDTYYVVETSLKYSNMSKGAFDPTIRPLVDVWRIGRENQRVPSKKELEKAMELINYNDISIDKAEKTVRLDKKNQAIDLGAVAKGFAADEVRDILIENKIKSAIIDLGGNIFALGNKQNGMAWNIGIQNPLADCGEYIGVTSVSNKSVVTSGVYERFLEKDGKKYHHILNPFTGYPVENQLVSTTIVSDKSIDGDALSTTLFTLGVKDGLKFIESIENVDAILVNSNKEVYITSGLKDKFKVTNNEYKIVN